ncbi:putative polysaccharide biosynthesis protein [Gordonia amarae NBRC 15530]|uniref:Putative polysaccharide biosynthesis protein n=1 Tax=Gordonia amarae NBRC 15530 TaxID=1075090 RepID=G7GQZ4_9ACTN|nr:putative polysaccharide biosynthesis protein [Gordonia amarae NBRC 15530]
MNAHVDRTGTRTPDRRFPVSGWSDPADAVTERLPVIGSRPVTRFERVSPYEAITQRLPVIAFDDATVRLPVIKRVGDGPEDSTDPDAAAGADLGAKATTGALWLGLINLASKGSQIVVTVVLASLLTEGELGLVSVAASLITVAQVIQMMGVYDVIARTARDPHAMARTVAALSVGVSLAIAVVVIAAAPLLASALGAPDAAPLIVITAFSLPFSAFGGVQMAMMHRTLDFRRRMLPDAGSALIGATVTVVLAALGNGAYSLAVGMLCTAVLQPILGTVAGVRVAPGWDRGAAGEALRWIRVVGPAAVVSTILINVDYPLIARLLGPDDVGVYSLAYRVAWVPYIMIAVVLGAVAFPVYSSLFRAGDGAAVPAVVGRFTYATLLAAGGLYVLIACMAHGLVVLGMRWEESVPVLLALCVYGVSISLLCCWYEVIRAAGRTGLYLIFETVHLVLLVSMLFAFTGFGVVYAAVAQIVAAAVLLPAVLVVMARESLAPPWRTLGRAVLGLAVPGVVCAAVATAFRWAGINTGPAGWLGVIIEGLVLAATFAVVGYLANRAVCQEFLQSRKGAR